VRKDHVEKTAVTLQIKAKKYMATFIYSVSKNGQERKREKKKPVLLYVSKESCLQEYVAV
jgi:hypothetical protein